MFVFAIIFVGEKENRMLNKVLIYLEKPVFQHGQLYVALSRATQKDNVKVFVPGDRWTKNIVNKDVLH